MGIAEAYKSGEYRNCLQAYFNMHKLGKVIRYKDLPHLHNDSGVFLKRELKIKSDNEVITIKQMLPVYNYFRKQSTSVASTDSEAMAYFYKKFRIKDKEKKADQVKQALIKQALKNQIKANITERKTTALLAVKVKKLIQKLIKKGLGYSFIGKYDSRAGVHEIMNIVWSYEFINAASDLETGDLVNLTKGLGIFETRCYFGSTTQVPKLLDLLRKRYYAGYEDLVDWLFRNRTNDYIPFGGYVSLKIKSYSEYKRSELQRAKHNRGMEQIKQQRHEEAVQRKLKNQREHETRSKANRELYYKGQVRVFKKNKGSKPK